MVILLAYSLILVFLRGIDLPIDFPENIILRIEVPDVCSIIRPRCFLTHLTHCKPLRDAGRFVLYLSRFRFKDQRSVGDLF
ncbi:hypothetical protein BGZ63DRAFT_391092 [Mariannaea sp. PMI_226]|nr:hypothetical protein BGZ63DRAFT_391092 [Mariannaea sp. PMI_226]